MAENQEYEAVLATEDDQNTAVAIKGTGKGSEQEIASGSGPQEDIELELVRVDEEAEGNDSPEQMSLLEIVEGASYNTLRERLTAKALMDSGENPLLLAIKVIEKLHERADRDRDIDPGGFIDLANHVEEFTLRFLDPLKHEDPIRREIFSQHPETDDILDTAIKFQQKKFFEHPIIMDLINQRWYTIGRDFLQRPFSIGWCTFTIWALCDVVLLPITLPLFFLLGLKDTSCFTVLYEYYFRIPYLVFLRDTLSYVALVGLHFWICVEPSQLAFSRLEWAILVFLFGRLLLEFTQIAKVASVKDKKMKQKVVGNYFRDRWNSFDLAILFTYFCAILPLRIVTWASSETETNNRALLVAGYLYGFNMMFLTFRTFGSILEIFEGVGTIQIALFHIIKDASVIVLHFIVITLGLSSTVTKVLVADNSMVAQDKEQYL